VHDCCAEHMSTGALTIEGEKWRVHVRNCIYFRAHLQMTLARAETNSRL